MRSNNIEGWRRVALAMPGAANRLAVEGQCEGRVIDGHPKYSIGENESKLAVAFAKEER